MKDNLFLRVLGIDGNFKLEWNNHYKVVNKKEYQNFKKKGLTVKNVFDIDNKDSLNLDRNSSLYFFNNEFFIENDISPTILNKKIYIIGIGALGSKMFKSLVLLGFNNFVIVDPDVVEQSNLNRQELYSHEDIGKLKVFVASNWANKYNPNINICKINNFISSNSDIEEIIKNNGRPDVVIKAYDEPQNHMSIFMETMQKYKIPFTSGGITANDIVAGPTFVPSKRIKFKWKNFTSVIHGKYPVVNFEFDILAGLLVPEIIKILNFNYEGLNFLKIKKNSIYKNNKNKKIKTIGLILIIILFFIIYFHIPWLMFVLFSILFLSFFKLDKWQYLFFAITTNLLGILYAISTNWQMKDGLLASFMRNIPLIWSGIIFLSNTILVSMLFFNVLGRVKKWIYQRK
ncbi:ThiF family adenylyltransferase [Fructobacillus evanidus]|uniref:ThiF family adenylyltransferase n=1 Tax=Fructobacillus evanidus TaxID=3064281 RepID=UPI002DB54221|nr:Molybdopterin or thiamine biosynthesis adenylyltransferase (ThiF) [Fructobacillus sp. LMG 32999]CAK1254250.1 Molybdopterin or thiamine biosynthesis adenylyltransferase (ThiF) [Fructobacillus sp. LMG 32999]